MGNYGQDGGSYANNSTTYTTEVTIAPPVATITPAQGQTSFIWEHRDDNQASGRTNHTDKTQFSDEDIAVKIDAYSVEDLDACSMHTYHIVEQIGGIELNSASVTSAIGSGTTFENISVSKGDFQGSILLSWNVKRLANQSNPETYLIERRVINQDDDSWQKMTTMDSDKTFRDSQSQASAWKSDGSRA